MWEALKSWWRGSSEPEGWTDTGAALHNSLCWTPADWRYKEADGWPHHKLVHVSGVEVEFGEGLYGEKYVAMQRACHPLIRFTEWEEENLYNLLSMVWRDKKADEMFAKEPPDVVEQDDSFPFKNEFGN